MSSESQINANRKNALKSTGPRTQEGKDASSQNAIKHGLCAKNNVIKTENQDEFDIYRDNMLADLSPDGAMEEMLVERIVSLSWRLKRAEHFQNAVVDALIEHGLHGASFGFGWTSKNRERAKQEAADGDMDVLLGIVINHDFANSKTLEQLLVYERRIESSLYRTIAELKKAKHIRKKQEEETAWAEVHPTSSCTNEPNSMEVNSGLAIPKGDTVARLSLMGNTENRIFQASQSNENYTNEANFKGISRIDLQGETGNLNSEISNNNDASEANLEKQTQFILENEAKDAKCDKNLF